MGALSHVKTNAVADFTGEYLKALLDYNPETGEMRWKVKRTKNAKANVGDLAGGITEDGYVRVMVDGKKYRVHRLAFLLMGEELPVMTDHINGNRSDNRWCNLRPADAKQNAKNAAKRCDGNTPVTGVGFMSRLGKWRARCNNNGVTVYLGVFDSLADAIAARQAANRRYAFHVNHGRIA